MRQDLLASPPHAITKPSPVIKCSSAQSRFPTRRINAVSGVDIYALAEAFAPRLAEKLKSPDTQR